MKKKPRLTSRSLKVVRENLEEYFEWWRRADFNLGGNLRGIRELFIEMTEVKPSQWSGSKISNFIISRFLSGRKSEEVTLRDIRGTGSAENEQSRQQTK